MPQTMTEIAEEHRHLHVVHKSYGEREDLRLLAACSNINGPRAPSGLATLDDKKVTCKRCLRIMEQLVQLEARAALKADALKLVEQLALSWIAEGTRGDEPGSAKESYELLARHGYTSNSTRTLLYRPDGSEVVR